jgi:hypothetical protein
LLSCSTDKEKNIVMESELQQSRWTMEEELNSSFHCFKQLFIDTDSIYNSDQPRGLTQLFYRDFLKLKITRDSIVNIKGFLGKTQWLEILDQFRLKATQLNGSQSARETIEKDWKFLNDNMDNIVLAP